MTDPVTHETHYVVPPRTVSQKVREVLLAIKLNQTYTKDEILAKYLNTVYFGHGAYGVQAAAQTYWGIDAKDLTPLESATLAGVIAAPSRFDPAANPIDSQIRRNFVLDRMAAEGYLSADRAAQLKSKKVRTSTTDAAQAAPPKLGYYLDYTKRALIAKFTEADRLRRRPEGDDRPGPDVAGLRRAGSTEHPPYARRPRRRPRRDRPRDRRGPRDVWRQGLREVAGEPRDGRWWKRQAGRFGLQGLHADRGDAGSCLAAIAMERSRHHHHPRSSLLHERRTLDPFQRKRFGGRHLHAGAGDRSLRQHDLRAARHAGGARQGGRGRARHGDPLTVALAGLPASVLHHARRRGGQPAGDDERLRDARRERSSSLGDAHPTRSPTRAARRSRRPARRAGRSSRPTTRRS